MDTLTRERKAGMVLNSSKELIDDIRQGKMVVLMDDEDRENEGDLIMAASRVRPQDINFMARYGRGLICLTLTRERCRQLRLPLMVSATDAKHLTNFTVSIEAAEGVTTGISAADRATTVRAAVAADARPSDIVQPGHIFPLMAQPGGVLSRAGHTEAGSDLARLAGFVPAAVIVEILNEDGSMARRGQLERFARRHKLKIGTIADLIQYRIEHERTVERVAECMLPSAYGMFRLLAYQDHVDDQLHLALVYGEIDPSSPLLVRVHLEDTLTDVLGASFDAGSDQGVREATRCGDWQGSSVLQRTMQRIAAAGCGVIVLIRKKDDAQALLHRITDYQLRDKGVALPKPPPARELRAYGLGAQVLVDLGVKTMRVIGAPKKLYGLSGFGLEIIEYLSCE